MAEHLSRDPRHGEVWSKIRGYLIRFERHLDPDGKRAMALADLLAIEIADDVLALLANQSSGDGNVEALRAEVDRLRSALGVLAAERVRIATNLECDDPAAWVEWAMGEAERPSAAALSEDGEDGR